MNDVTTLPVIPLREAVLFPGVTSPIAAGRPGTLRAIEAALKTEDKTIFVVAQRDNLEDVSPEILYTMGTVASIGPVQRGPSGMRLLLNGLYRGVAMRYEDDEEYLVAAVRRAEEMAPLDPKAPEFTALYAEARERASELGRRAGMPKEAVQQFSIRASDHGRSVEKPTHCSSATAMTANAITTTAKPTLLCIEPLHPGSAGKSTESS